MDFRERLYQTYPLYKEWTGTGTNSSASLFEGELQSHGIKAPASVLEIGFGSGEFLQWLQSHGFQAVGIEVNSQLVEEAKAKNLEVYHLSLQRLSDLKASREKFDVVVLFDVLEHLYPQEILELFDQLHSLLVENGKVLCRFPNGLSPFNTQTQYADLTHITVLTPERMRQVGLATGFQVHRYENSFRSLEIGKRSKLAKKILYRFRDVFEIIVGLFYFGGRTPLDPNLSLSLVKVARKET